MPEIYSLETITPSNKQVMSDLEILAQWAEENDIRSEMLDEIIHELKATEAAAINNGGLEAQLRYFLQAFNGFPNSIEAIKELIRDCCR